MRLVCLSDTHTLHERVEVPDGDVLIHAGDFCGRGDTFEAFTFAQWFLGQPHRHKVVVAGNHDVCLEKDSSLGRKLFGGAYLFESGVEIEGLKFWGAPWQPEFYDWAFNLPRGPRLREKWAKIPVGVDVLITHGPPHGVLDRVGDRLTGCEELKKALVRVKPKLHIFGHIHEGYGREGGSVNASICTAAYRPTNSPIVEDL